LKRQRVGVKDSPSLSKLNALTGVVSYTSTVGRRMWERFMSELCEEHIGPSDGGGSDPGEVSVTAILQAAYEEVVAGGRTNDVSSG
jgi:hypothetical protein